MRVEEKRREEKRKIERDIWCFLTKEEEEEKACLL